MSLPQPILAYVEGIDSDIRSLTPQEINALSDWFGQWLAKTPQATRALTLRALLKNALPADCYRSFGVADGLSIPYNTDNDDDPLNQVPRHMRFVVIALPDNPDPDGIDTTLAILKKTLCIVSSPFPDSGDAPLQVASWDPNALGPKQGLMRFYQRQYEGWVYFGDSFNAFSSGSVGKGPFDGHIGGAMIMKELELPWTHWYDQSNISDFIASLGSTKIAGSKADPSNVLHDTLFGEPYSPFSKLGRAEDLEPIVRQSVKMWYQSRFTRDFVDPKSKKGLPQITSAVEQWISHILLNRSMNIAASQTSSVQAAAGSRIGGIPATMFYNSNALQTVLPNAGNSVKEGFSVQNASFYSDGIEKLDLNICYKDRQDGTRFLVAVPKTEGPFPFPIIEPGVEDYQGIQTLVKWAKSMKYPALLPPKAVAAMLMVDFFNPTYSARREKLMKYVPASATLIPATNTYNVLEQIVSSLQASDASHDTTSPESELLGLLNTPDNAWETVFTARINAYADRVLQRLTKKDGVEDYMVLAEGRRMIYQGREDEKPSGGLNEFYTTLPVALNSVPWSEMQEDGYPRPMPSTSKKWFSRSIRAGKDGAFEHRRGSSGPGDGTVPWYLKRTATGGCPMTRAGT